MPKVSTYNIAGAQTGEMELNDSVFGVEVNEAVMRQAVLRQLANERLGTHATKTRGLVPPPTHKGLRVLPTRARPVPFCFQGFLPPPRTSRKCLVRQDVLLLNPH